ncbi:MAG: HypC/HybG/HupF family hydrogenase formation chaperone [Gammaproteobacteria bacterium]|nr:HypC/HybG/HupF family hydrogenase formation chaperone [Gammaproteobacteria bacterium]
MCIGLPMQVQELHEFYADCDDNGAPLSVDIRLIERPKIGDWLLVFLGSAREILTESNALKMRDAVAAISHIMSGESNVDHLFADLIDREPQLPDHLKPPPKDF